MSEAEALPVTAIASPLAQLPANVTESPDVKNEEALVNVSGGAAVLRIQVAPTDPAFSAASVCVKE